MHKKKSLFLIIIVFMIVIIATTTAIIWHRIEARSRDNGAKNAPAFEQQTEINELSVEEEDNVNVASAEKDAKFDTAESIILPVYTYGMQSDDAITCEIISSIAYVSLQDYLVLYDSLNLKSQMDLKKDNCRWILNRSGKSFIFDTIKNQIALEVFPKVNSDQLEHLSPFLKKISTETNSNSQSEVAYTVSLDDYGMMIYQKEDRLYLPFSLASMFLSDGMDMFYMFSKDGIYLIDLYADEEDSNSAYPGNYCGNVEYNKTVFQEPRTKEDAAFAYGLICINIDYFYGYPEKSMIEADPYRIQSRGLDKALDQTEFGKLAKKYLLSQNWAEYICGLEMLDILFSDGHCRIPYSNPTHYWKQNEGCMDSALSEKDTTQLRELKNWLYSTEEYRGLLLKCEANMQISRGIWKAREERWSMPSCIAYGEDTYHEQGDTAIISFDNFKIDHLSWNEYYANGCKGEIPNSDCIGTVYYGLKKASENPKIQNVIIDLADNLGGESDAVAMLLAFLTGKAYFRTEDTQTGIITRVNYKADCNFDGVFDDQDWSIYDFNYKILVSGSTFSAASALALYGNEEGVFIVGTPVNGGCCNVQLYSDGEGILYCLSSHIRVVNGNGITSDQMDESFIDQLLDIPDSLVDYYGAESRDCNVFYDASVLN